MFLGYKLKVQKANKVGLQYGTNYQNELKSYRNQLSKNYVNDSKVTNELVKEAYDRMNEEVRDRVRYLIGHHHTYTNIEGTDYRILVEADFLVNIYEDELTADAIETVKEKYFITRKSREILTSLYQSPNEAGK